MRATRLAPHEFRFRRERLRVLIVAIVMGLAVLAGVSPRPAASQDLKKSGTVEIQQTQIAWIGSANLGGGQLFYQGKSYSFTIGGLGIGGFGISRIQAVGTVYNMSNLNQFAGTYGQARYGFAAGTTGSGELWLENPAGVVIQLKCQREGIALSLGGDAIYIQFN
jgi:hypothetical protein